MSATLLDPQPVPGAPNMVTLDGDGAEYVANLVGHVTFHNKGAVDVKVQAVARGQCSEGQVHDVPATPFTVEPNRICVFPILDAGIFADPATLRVLFRFTDSADQPFPSGDITGWTGAFILSS